MDQFSKLLVVWTLVISLTPLLAQGQGVGKPIVQTDWVLVHSDWLDEVDISKPFELLPTQWWLAQWRHLSESLQTQINSYSKDDPQLFAFVFSWPARVQIAGATPIELTPSMYYRQNEEGQCFWGTKQVPCIYASTKYRHRE